MSNPGQTISLQDRIKGCLVGAIGTELGYAKAADPERYEWHDPKDVLSFMPPARQQDGR